MKVLAAVGASGGDTTGGGDTTVGGATTDAGGGGGNTSPFLNCRGRTGWEAVPTGWPCPEKA